MVFRLLISFFLIVPSLHASEHAYKGLRQAYFNEKVKTQMKFCTEKYLVISKNG